MRQGGEDGSYLKASDDGKSLVITKINKEHNHKISRAYL